MSSRILLLGRIGPIAAGIETSAKDALIHAGLGHPERLGRPAKNVREIPLGRSGQADAPVSAQAGDEDLLTDNAIRELVEMRYERVHVWEVDEIPPWAAEE